MMRPQLEEAAKDTVVTMEKIKVNTSKPNHRINQNINADMKTQLFLLSVECVERHSSS